MLRHMCPPLGLGKRCPARVAYKVRKDHIFTRVSYGCPGVGAGPGGRGQGFLSAQRGVNFSVVVSLVLFLFLFVESGGGLVGVVALCGGVGLAGGGSKTIRMRVRLGCVSTGGDEKRDLLSSFAPCMMDTQTHLHKHAKAIRIIINRINVNSW